MHNKLLFTAGSNPAQILEQEFPSGIIWVSFGGSQLRLRRRRRRWRRWRRRRLSHFQSITVQCDWIYNSVT